MGSEQRAETVPWVPCREEGPMREPRFSKLKLACVRAETGVPLDESLPLWLQKLYASWPSAPPR